MELHAFEQMKQTATFTDEDVQWLKKSGEVLADQTEAILDVWYGFVGSHPHLLASFTTDGKPNAAYLAAVRKRFGEWILKTAAAKYDQRWLDEQLEIGRRHHRTKKNTTDGVSSTDVVPFRHLIPLAIPIVTTLAPFLAKRGHSTDEVAKMQQAWLKSVLLQLALWSEPYVAAQDY